jgi:aldehyde:ferredoxin oxidoreductase
MIKGYAGKIVRINLSTREVREEALPEGLALSFIGGRGINSKILYDEVEPEMEPLSPANCLIFGTGLLVGTMAPACGRGVVTARSPLTNGHGDAHSGGFWAPELKYAGYDHIVIKGRAEKPVYLWIHDEQVEIRDATHLWGKLNDEVHEAIRNELKDETVQILCIGPAGENMVRSACIMHGSKRSASRGGMGAVMGSKNLKAIAIKGRKGIQVANPEEFEEIATEIFSRKSFYRDMLTFMGTPFLILMEISQGASAGTKNMQTSLFPEEKELTPAIYHKKYLRRSKACFACGVRCGRMYSITDGDFAGLAGEGPDWGVMLNLAVQPRTTSWPAMLKADWLVNQYGMDASEVGMSIAFAMECYQKGILTDEDTGGLKLEWGDHRIVLNLIEMIAKREGFGDILADGLKIAGEKIGGEAPKYALTVKGSNITSDVRGRNGMLLGYVTSTRGPDHLRGLVFDGYPLKLLEEKFGKEVTDPLGTQKAPALKWMQDFSTLPDCFGTCKLQSVTEAMEDVYTLQDYSRLYKAATGIEVSEQYLMEVGERITNVERSFGVKVAGWSRKDDTVPDRFFEESLDAGPHKGVKVRREDLDLMLDDYYQVRGWDVKTGVPTKEKLKELGLNAAMQDLEKLGRLGKKKGAHQ